jgi:hypothetical protein
MVPADLPGVDVLGGNAARAPPAPTTRMLSAASRYSRSGFLAQRAAPSARSLWSLTEPLPSADCTTPACRYSATAVSASWAPEACTPPPA